MSSDNILTLKEEWDALSKEYKDLEVSNRYVSLRYFK